MLAEIIQWDKNLFLHLNGLHAPWLDPIMDWISHSMIPAFIILALTSFYGIKFFNKKKGLALVFFALLSIGITDSVSSRILKPGFERLRPCHNPEFVDQFHTVGNCWGGKFGFVSSHAANTFGIAFFLWLVFRRKNNYFALLIPYAALVSYTRIYLAKHYPLDLVGGAMLGALSAWLLYFVWSRWVLREEPLQNRQ
ncbi:MAG: phosphatase PAP2 family protein [Halobacteriovoraceae bacterium]|nr:phosphatase PAP2 family protein [Halobacteriovoraceae bacterium]